MPQGSRGPNGLPADHEIDAPVHLPSFSSGIRSHRLTHSNTAGVDVLRLHSLLDQEGSNRIRACLGQALVKLESAHIVRVSLDVDVQVRIGKKNSRHFREPFPSAHLQGVLAGIEKNIRHINDQTTGSFPRLQDLVELLQKTLSGLLGLLLSLQTRLFRLLGGLLSLQRLRLGGLLLR